MLRIVPLVIWYEAIDTSFSDMHFSQPSFYGIVAIVETALD